MHCYKILYWRFWGNILKLIPFRMKYTKNQKVAIQLLRWMYDVIGDDAGFGHKTEYNVGISNINENLHCIFGSAMRSNIPGASEIGEIYHIEEEISLMERSVVEYQMAHPRYVANNDETTITNAMRIINEINRIISFR